MQLDCPHCNQTLQFSGKRPAFCAYCGKPLPPASEDATAAFDVSMPPAPQDGDPAEVGGYRLLRVLGEGGMGRVYEAEDAATGRRVALKLIAADCAASPDAVERFRREGRLASGVTHPRCVFVLAADEAGGRPYIVMELMPGETLQDLVNRRGPLPVEEALSKVLDVIDGLREAHRFGVVHRDVKPSNCFLDAEGRVKVGDFGLAKSLAGAAALTRTGTFLGTPLYASPEQIKGGGVGPQSDVYSTAATLYCLLTGKAPFQGGDSAAVLARIVSDPAPPMRSLRRDLPVALDRAVLRGLERDPARRWRDLDEFRAALLPFVPGRLSIGGLGIRFGAYLIDQVLLTIVQFAVWIIAGALTAPFTGELTPTAAVAGTRMALGVAMNVALFLLYFAPPEAWWGCTPGKRWLRLRVCKAATGERPTLGQAALRALVLFFLTNLGTLVSDAAGALSGVNPAAPNPAAGWLFSASFLVFTAVGIGLTLCTMRARNGYRGLHEMVSGTRVVRLPEPPAARRPRRDQGPEVVRSADLPERLGPFEVQGALPGAADGTLLAGRDPALGRRVWIRMGPPDGAPAGPARREVNRTTRLRWLAGGRDGPRPWDAFLAPDGAPLADVVADGRLSWAELRPLLGRLADELAEAEADGTLPAALSTAQVWLRPDGQALLLDTPVGDAAAPADPSPLALLARTAALAFEGRPPPEDGEPARVRAPLPPYASALLGHLLGAGKPYADVREFRAALSAVADRPAATTRPRRLAHVAVLALLLSFGLGGAAVAGVLFIVAPFTLTAEAGMRQELRTRLHAVIAQDAAAALNPDPIVRVLAASQAQDDLRLDDALARDAERDREEHEAVLRSMTGFSRELVHEVEEQQAFYTKRQQGPAGPYGSYGFLSKPNEQDRLRSFVRLQEGRTVPTAAAMARAMALPQVVIFGFWPAVWVAWAFLFRGGLSYPLMGLALVRGNGRPALRVQCAWRAFLVWAPMVGLAAAAVWLNVAYWERGAAWLLTASSAAWWGALLLPPLYAVVAVGLPRRGPHDWLAGAYVVPR